MKAPVTLFEEGCLEWGLGPRAPDTVRNTVGLREITDMANRWITQVERVPAVQGLIPIYFDYVMADAINAVADIREGTGLIALTGGSVTLAGDTFRRLLSHPLVLPQIGNPQATEVTGPQHGDGVSKDMTSLIQKRQNEGRPIKVPPPVNPARLSCSQLLTKIFLDFLIAHELGHITNGHVGYLLDSVGIRYMLELRAEGTPKTPAAHDPIIRQTLEMDADSVGVALSLVA